jgi:hypothetical protein
MLNYPLLLPACSPSKVEHSTDLQVLGRKIHIYIMKIF